ncbi:MAG: M28 family peptidase [Sphingomicrobium sp.]
MTNFSKAGALTRRGAIEIAIAIMLTSAAVAGANSGSPPRGVDLEIRQWWTLTSELSVDSMEGRDTGSPGYDRAAALVARRFAEAGLKPAGVDGGWFQPIAFDDLRIDRAVIAFGGRAMRLNHDVQLSPTLGTPRRLSVAATFRGYCAKQDLLGVIGKMVVCYGRPAPARVKDFDRAKALRDAGAAGMLTIAAPGLPGEPIRWPFAYSRSVSIAGEAAPAGRPFLSGIINPDSLSRVTPGAARILVDGARGRPLKHAELGRFTNELTVRRTATRSANVLGLLPGTDPALANQIMVVSAHLDGYGRGEAVGGDTIYNGALDDAAYVALLEQLALQRAGKGFRRPILFAVFTGEEKGLLGSTWFVAHPTVPLSSIMADINLDQVRPLYPLRLMTVHGLVESGLGGHVRAVANRRGIAIQEDPEPERNLLRRSDNWPFMSVGIPGTSFVFATFDDASRARYRDWYQRRYHHPADDLSTPIDWHAAGDFNRFFTALTESVADAAAPVTWNPGGRPNSAK